MASAIVTGYHPEHGGADALRLSRMLAGVLALREVIVTALPWPSYLASHQDLLRMAESEMKDEFDAIRDARGEALETRAIPSGSAALAIHTTADDEEAALIVIGSNHRSPIGRTLLGSVGESLMHGAPCAVAIAPRGFAEREEHRLLRFCVAYDGSPEARVALDSAVGLAERCHGTLTILTVADYPRYGYATAWSVLATGEIADADRKYKQSVLAEALATVPADLPCTSRLPTGSAADHVIEASDDFDLMLLGSRAYGALHRTLLGSTTRKVIRSAACPVLVLPRGSGDDPLGVRLAADD